MSTGSPDIDSRVDALYVLPLERFVAERNALAKELKKEGHRDVAERVGRLVKPSVAAWAANRVVLEHASAFRAFLEAGEAVRRSHGDDPSTLQAGIRARRVALDRLVRLAEGELRGHERSVTKPLLAEVTRTLEALSAGVDEGVVAGRLSEALDAPGFAALSGFRLAPGVPKTPAQPASPTGPWKDKPTPLEASDSAAASSSAHPAGPRAEAAEEREEARRRLREANAAMRAAEAGVARARRMREGAQSTAERLRRLLEETRARLAAHQREAEEANAALEAARAAEREAGRALERARETLREAE